VKEEKVRITSKVVCINVLVLNSACKVREFDATEETLSKSQTTESAARTNPSAFLIVPTPAKPDPLVPRIAIDKTSPIAPKSRPKPIKQDFESVGDTPDEGYDSSVTQKKGFCRTFGPVGLRSP
jgi:hypothetical protein